MRFLGFSIPVIVLIVGAYVIGAMHPGLWTKVRASVGG